MTSVLFHNIQLFFTSQNGFNTRESLIYYSGFLKIEELLRLQSRKEMCSRKFYLLTNLFDV